MFYLHQLIPHIVPRKTSRAAKKYLHRALTPFGEKINKNKFKKKENRKKEKVIKIINKQSNKQEFLRELKQRFTGLYEVYGCLAHAFYVYLIKS